MNDELFHKFYNEFLPRIKVKVWVERSDTSATAYMQSKLWVRKEPIKIQEFGLSFTDEEILKDGLVWGRVMRATGARLEPNYTISLRS